MKKRSTEKRIIQLIDSYGKALETDDEIKSEVKRFYENLYGFQRVSNFQDIIEELNNTHNKNSEEEVRLLDKDIALDEIKKVVDDLKIGKACGIDGFTAEFYKIFFKDLGCYLLRSFKSAFSCGKLLHFQNLGLITLLPKGNKPRNQLKNWRPISLLNVQYKILSNCIANRIKPLLEKKLHCDQKGFLSGRYIGENIRLIYDIIAYAECKDIPGILLFIDFEKAFDCVSHDFLWNVLDYFNYGSNVTKWIKLLYANSASSVIINGSLTTRFDINRGCRQGDPLSPYLFLLSAEILGLLVRKSSKIKGLNIEDKEYKILQYADDTVLCLDSFESLRNALELLDFFSKYSGLKVNITKTQVLCIGSLRKCSNIDLHNVNGCDVSLVNEKYITYLGVQFCIDLKNLPDLNYDRIFDKLKRQMISWSKRNITVFGRVVLVKSLLVSQLNHLFTSIPNPSEQLLKAINVSFFRFIWNNKPDKISRKQIVSSYANGGLKMVDITHFSHALKLTWIRRIMNNDCDDVTHLMHAFIPTSLELEWGKGDMYFNQLSYKMTNLFWKEFFQILTYFVRQVQSKTTAVWQLIPLWCNSDIKIGGKDIYFSEWWDKGIRFINDLLDDQGNILTREQCEMTYSIRLPFLIYHALRHIIKNKYISELHENHSKLHGPLCPQYISELLKEKRGCGHIYSIMLNENKCNLVTLSRRWCTNVIALEDSDLQSFFNMTFRCSIYTSVRYFQFRLLHKILYLNKDLVKMKIIADSSCSFCKKKEEDMVHFFYECEVSKSIWNSLVDWLYNITGYRIQLSLLHILFGFKEKRNDSLNCIIIWTKLRLYHVRTLKATPTFQAIKQYIRSCYANEKQLSILTRKTDNFYKKWLHYDKILDS